MKQYIGPFFFSALMGMVAASLCLVAFGFVFREYAREIMLVVVAGVTLAFFAGFSFVFWEEVKHLKKWKETSAVATAAPQYARQTRPIVVA